MADVRAFLEAHELNAEANSSNEIVLDVCPNCDASRKCYVNADEGVFDCKVCGHSGSFSDLKKFYQPADPKQVLMETFHELTIRNLIKSPAALAYLEDRGIGQESIAEFRYGYADASVYAALRKSYADADLRAVGLVGEWKGEPYDTFSNHIIIPYVRSGQYVTFQGRNLNPQAKRKYVFATGLEPGLYHPEDLYKRGRVFLTEGAFKRDALAAAGYHATALPGANDFKRYLAELQNCEDLWIVLDADSPDDKGRRPGQDAAEKIAKALKRVTVLTLPLTGGQKKVGVDDFIAEFGAQALDKIRYVVWKDGKPQRPTNLAFVVRDWREQAMARGESRGLLTGHERFDSTFEGFHDDSLVFAAGAAHMGKCLGRGTPIVMFDGTVKSVEDVANGDLLMGPDSTPRLVRGVTTGRSMLHRVTQERGADAYVVNDDHILSVKSSRRGGLSEPFNLVAKDWYSQSSAFRKNLRGYMSKVEFPEREVGLDPYFLGLWLGDGSSNAPAVTTKDPEIVEYLVQISHRYDLTLRAVKNTSQPENKSATYHLGKRHGRLNPIKEVLKKYGILGAKRIPQEYLSNSRSIRLALLAGLLDTDGYYGGSVGYEISQKSEVLARQVAFLARSLGFHTTLKLERKECVNNGVWGEYYRIRITGDVAEIPLRIQRKKCFKSPQANKCRDKATRGIALEPLGIGDYYGFELDGDGLFLLGDFTVTHNTSWVEDAAVRVYRNNPEVIVNYYSNDDSLYTTIARWVAKLGQLRPKDCRYPVAAFGSDEEMMARFDKAVSRLSKMSDRLSIVDSSYNVTLETLGQQLIEWRAENPTAKRIVFIDAFRKTKCRRDGEIRDELMLDIYKSSLLKEIAQGAHIPIVVTHEVPKLGGKRPNTWNLRGSGTLEYDADVLLLFYQEAHVLGIDKTEMFVPFEIGGRDERSPVLEVICGKDKICGTATRTTDFFALVKSASAFQEVCDEDYDRLALAMAASERREKQ